jgi:heme-degrading monooxygenase HmoA
MKGVATMFAYILRAPGTPPTEQTDEFFRRFTAEPGLLHAFDLQGVDDPDDAVLVAIWEDREAAERYLTKASLRKEVDAALPVVTRTKYTVRNTR